MTVICTASVAWFNAAMLSHFGHAYFKRSSRHMLESHPWPRSSQVNDSHIQKRLRPSSIVWDVEIRCKPFTIKNHQRDFGICILEFEYKENLLFCILYIGGIVEVTGFAPLRRSVLRCTFKYSESEGNHLSVNIIARTRFRKIVHVSVEAGSEQKGHWKIQHEELVLQSPKYLG